MSICLECNKTVAGTGKWYTPIWKICWGHHQKVSQLEYLKTDEISNDDVLLISDISKKESKQVKVGDLLEYVRRNK